MRNVTLVNGIFILQPIHNEISHRPMEFNYDGNIHNQLLNDTRDGKSVSTGSLSNVASKIIMPSTTSKGTRDILGGWNEQHIAGYLLYRIETPAEIKHEVHVVYSDKFDVSMSGKLNPDTRFTIDSRKVIASTLNQSVMTPGGTTVSSDFMSMRPVDVIRRDECSIKDDLIRPCDSLYKMQSIEIGETFDDFRSKASVIGVDANSRDSDSGTYLSKVLNSYKLSKASNDEGNFGYSEDTIVLDSAAGYLNAEHSTESAVMTLLTQRSQFGESGNFEYGELCRLFDEPGNPVSSRCSMSGQVTGQMENLRNESSDMHGNDKSTNLAFRLNDKLGKELSARLLASATIEISNNSLGQPDVAISEVSAMFPQMSDRSIMDAAEELRNIIMIETIGTVRDYADSYSITIDATAYSYNMIRMSLDGKGNDVFSAPSFCNALSSSMVSDGGESQTDFAAGLKSIIDETFKTDHNANNGGRGLSFSSDGGQGIESRILTPENNFERPINNIAPQKKIFTGSANANKNANFFI